MDHPHPHAHTPHHDAHHGTRQSAQPASPAAQLDHHHKHDADDQAELLDLDAEVLAEHIASLAAWLPLKTAPRRIVDLGCGTGTGTFALLDRFPDAHVIAVDSSAVHLQHLRKKACARGLERRVRTVQADLDDPAWPVLGSPDLVWASASMHHMAHAEQALRSVHEALTPGGLFAVVELAGFPRFLPADAPEDRPGLEERCHAVTDRLDAERMPHRGADWGPMLTAAGFTVESERTLAVNIEGSRSEAIGRYALGGLRRIRDFVAPELSPEDRAALDRLLDTDGPHSILRRDDLAVRTERTVWAARRA
ncbi:MULTISPECIES: class I SAM-dependent methyltransferase [Streptomyces]|uniref:class I SAM-dependent methyltransferase n=1 Tax=Streptomyces TaxID=1883 RepID=UPI0029BC330B|nr:class I SAM-dependent methyltransferase [Streptomyces sp. WI03-4A]MDX2592803.1 class I SAM-dependent methyltransferase [Streptomyces sp. WI03-4A]